MRVDIDKLEALEKAATPGPWVRDGLKVEGAQPGHMHDIAALYDLASATPHGEAGANAELVAMIPELVREVRELRGIAEAARELVIDGCEDCRHIPARLEAALAEYDAGGAK